MDSEIYYKNFIRRRVPVDNLDREMGKSMKRVGDYIKRSQAAYLGRDAQFRIFQERTIEGLMEQLYPLLMVGMEEESWWEPVYFVLKDKYKREMSNYFNEFVNPIENISESATLDVRRRLKLDDLENFINKAKFIVFDPEKTPETLAWNVCDFVSTSMIPGNVTLSMDQKDYAKVQDDLTKILHKEFSKELEDYFSSVLEEYADDAVYVFVKHDAPYYGDWKGFSKAFRSFENMVTTYHDWLDGIDWVEIKKKMDDINYYPDYGFDGFKKSRPLKISSIGDKGNNWGYNFSIVKKVPKEKE
jgi:hypothetical protein